MRREAYHHIGLGFQHMSNPAGPPIDTIAQQNLPGLYRNPFPTLAPTPIGQFKKITP